jgi:hypothetical protein
MLRITRVADRGIVTDKTLIQIRGWFEAYARQYMAAAPKKGASRAMMGLKLVHSRRVAAEARSLAAELGWERGDQNTAEALGWLHDTGRFSQMAEFGTFRDAHSVSHALRGHEVLSQAGILRNCSAKRARQILDSVLHHSGLKVPSDVHADSLAFVRLIRDADKLDIFRVFSEVILENRVDDYPEIVHGVDLNGAPSPELLQELGAGRVPGYRLVRSLNDWKLLLVSWVYDLCYVPTCRRVLERGVVSSLAEMMPNTPDVAAIVATATAHLEDRCARSSRRGRLESRAM